jgi:hypothetical protein
MRTVRVKYDQKKHDQYKRLSASAWSEDCADARITDKRYPRDSENYSAALARMA